MIYWAPKDPGSSASPVLAHTAQKTSLGSGRFWATACRCPWYWRIIYAGAFMTAEAVSSPSLNYSSWLLQPRGFYCSEGWTFAKSLSWPLTVQALVALCDSRMLFKLALPRNSYILPSLTADTRYSLDPLWTTVSVCWSWGNNSQILTKRCWPFLLTSDSSAFVDQYQLFQQGKDFRGCEFLLITVCSSPPANYTTDSSPKLLYKFPWYSVCFLLKRHKLGFYHPCCFWHHLPSYYYSPLSSEPSMSYLD